MPITNKHVKDSLLEGKKVRANNWEISINNNDEVVIFPPTGDGFSTTLAHLDKAVDDYCKKANVRKPGSSKKLAEEKVGPDSETQNLLKSPLIKKSPPAENTPDTDMNVGSEDDQPYTPKPTDKSPEVYPAPGGDGMPSTDLGSDSEGDMKWGTRYLGSSYSEILSDFLEYLGIINEEGHVGYVISGYNNLESVENVIEALFDIGYADISQKVQEVNLANLSEDDILDESENLTEIGNKLKTLDKLIDAPTMQDAAYEVYEDLSRKWGRSVKIRDTFSDDSAPMDFYRELKAKKPSAELLKDITNERKWVANNRYADVPKKWEPTVKKMKDKPEIDNPYALANWMENEGYTPGGKDKKSNTKKAGSPGKFEGVPDEYLALAEELYGEQPDEQAGSVTEDGIWYGLYWPEKAIMSEDFQGFVDIKVYEDQAELENDWDDIDSSFYSDMDEDDFESRSYSKKKAGPKLREKWDDKGSYHRDIEAESPEELHALTRALGGEEIDWSPFKKNEEDLNEVMAEDSMDEVTACAKDSESDIEAVDDKAKDYYDKYFEQADSDYGKQLTKGDVTDRKRIQRDKKKSQMAPAPAPKQQAPAPQADPMAQQAPAAPPAGGAPAAPGGAPKPGAPGAGGMKPGTGDAGLQALGWTPEDIQLLDEQDKQKILQVQLNKPGTKQPKAPAAPGVPEKGPAPAAPGAPTAPAVPGQGSAPAPQKPAPAPVASKLAKEIMKKLQFKRAQMLLTAQEMVNTEEAAPVSPAPAPVAPAGQESMTEFQGPAGEAAEGATVEQKAFQILSEVQQMPVQATTPESVPSTKAQELSKRLLTELGMPIEEAKTLFGVSKSNQGLISLFK